MMNKKVCMITWGHDALDDRIFYKEALSLRKNYAQVTVVALGVNEIRCLHEIKIVRIKRAPFSPFTMWKMWSAARKEKADFYHLHEPQLLFVGLFLKLLCRARIIYDAHEHLPEMIRDFSTRPAAAAALLATAFSLLELFFVRIADAVCVASDLLISRFSQSAKRIVAIYNYPRVDLFDVGQLPSGALPLTSASQRIVLCHGQMGRARNTLILIKAIKIAAQRIERLKLVLLGHIFGDSYETTLMDFIRREAAEELVDLLEPVPHEQIAAYIAQSEVGLVILPPLSVFRESLPIKLFEYMACGVSVVGSKLPAIERIVQQARCGLLVDPTDVDDIAEGICHLLENQKEARAMGMRGHQAVQTKYNWSNMEVKLLALYKGLEQ